MEASLLSLEFDRVLTLVALEARTSLGREAVQVRRPARTLEACEDGQRELAEMLRIYQQEGPLPFGGLTDVGQLLRGEEVLELEQSWQVLRSARATQALREAILRNERAYPLLEKRAGRIDDLSELISSVGRFFTRDGKLREEASAALRSIRSRIQTKRSAIQKTLYDLMSRQADAVQDSIITIRGDRYCIPVRTDHRSAIPGILHERSGSGASLFVEPMQVVEMNNDVAELLMQEREEIARITRHVSQLLAEAAGSVLDATAVAGELDAIQACAVVAERLGSTRPRFSEKRELELIQARHPLLDERIADLRQTAFGEDDGASPGVVPVSLHIHGEQPALLITGPNAGGKTVTLKTAGLLVAMASSGLPVPADDGTLIPVVDDIHVLIGDDQNVLEHLSTFSAYLVRLRRVLENATPRSLVLLDELGSGTDPEEGSALAAAVAEHLLEVGCLLVVTTHLASLKSFAIDDARIANAGMEFDPASGRPTYHLIAGVPGRSRALELAALMGLPEKVVANARQKLGERYGEMDSLIATLQRAMGELATERIAAGEQRREAESLTATLREEQARLAGERESLSKKYREEIERIRDEMGRRLQSELRRMRESDRAERQRASAQAIFRHVTEPADRSPILEHGEPEPVVIGSLVRHRRFGMVGTVTAIDGGKAQLSVGGKTVHAELDDLRVEQDDKAARKKKPVRTLQPDKSTDLEAPPSAELNLIGHHVDDAIEESDRFIDRSLLEGRRAVRVIHGFGTGALRKALREHLQKHPGVAGIRPGGENEGGDGATIAILDV